MARYKTLPVETFLKYSPGQDGLGPRELRGVKNYNDISYLQLKSLDLSFAFPDEHMERHEVHRF